MKFKHTAEEYKKIFEKAYKGYGLAIRVVGLNKSYKSKGAMRFILYILAIEDSQEKVMREGIFGRLEPWNYIEFESYRVFYPNINEKKLREEYDKYKKIFIDYFRTDFRYKDKTNDYWAASYLIVSKLHDENGKEYLQIGKGLLYGPKRKERRFYEVQPWRK